MQDVTALTSRLDETIEEWRREAMESGRAEGVAKGHAEGRAEGHAEAVAEALLRQRTMLRRMVARRFDPQIGQEVGLLLEKITDWDQLAVVGESILDANEGAELRDRVTALLHEP